MFMYTLVGSPRIEHGYCDEWETVMVCEVQRSDDVVGDVWIVAGVPDYHRGSSEAAGTQHGYLAVRVFGDSPDMWCPPAFDSDDREEIIAACEAEALKAHNERLRA